MKEKIESEYFTTANNIIVCLPAQWCYTYDIIEYYMQAAGLL